MIVKERLKFNSDEEKQLKIYKNKLIDEYNQLVEDKKINENIY